MSYKQPSQEVFASINKNSRQLEAHMEGVISFLNMNRMPTGLKAKVKSYVRFKFIHDQSDEKVCPQCSWQEMSVAQ
jgi:hypothetical protein